ncbi:MAPEG family protein [Burkholderia thailandensis]|uniref:MAPEG family protein n=1 Tax=Burkholderia thailandensis TaxID=57975 RepID=UPI0009E4AE4D|nr:MAPEG family protein [Burkholderia thailandensis]PNE73154.1 MAPEG family protein [Burkholderia thailandensis]
MNFVAAFCTFALGCLVFGLGFWVSLMRKSARIAHGATADPGDFLYRLIRAHGNTTEYAPFLALLILYLGAHHPANWAIGTMIVSVLCRYILVVGFLMYPTLAKPNGLRFLGAAGTYVTGFMLCLAMVLPT